MWSDGKPSCFHTFQLPSQGLWILLSIQSLQSSAITIRLSASHDKRGPCRELCYQACEGYKSSTPTPTNIAVTSLPLQLQNSSSDRQVYWLVTSAYLFLFLFFFSFLFFCELYFSVRKKIFSENFHGKPVKIPITWEWSNSNTLICVRNITNLIFGRYTYCTDSFPLCLPQTLQWNVNLY